MQVTVHHQDYQMRCLPNGIINEHQPESINVHMQIDTLESVSLWWISFSFCSPHCKLYNKHFLTSVSSLVYNKAHSTMRVKSYFKPWKCWELDTGAFSLLHVQFFFILFHLLLVLVLSSCQTNFFSCIWMSFFFSLSPISWATLNKSSHKSPGPDGHTV